MTPVTRDPNQRSKGKRSRSPGRLTLLPKICHIFGTRRPANFKLGVSTDCIRRSASSTCAVSSITWKLWVVVEITTCRRRGNIVSTRPQAAQLVFTRSHCSFSDLVRTEGGLACSCTTVVWCGALVAVRLPDLQSGGCGFESQPGLLRTKVYSAFRPSGVGKWVPSAAEKAKAGMAHTDCGWTCGCAGKTVQSLENTCHTWALLRWCFTTKRRYIKCMHLYLYICCTAAQEWEVHDLRAYASRCERADDGRRRHTLWQQQSLLQRRLQGT